MHVAPHAIKIPGASVLAGGGSLLELAPTGLWQAIHASCRLVPIIPHLVHVSLMHACHGGNALHCRRQGAGRKRGRTQAVCNCIPLQSVLRRVTVVPMLDGRFALNDLLGESTIDFTQASVLDML